MLREILLAIQLAQPETDTMLNILAAPPSVTRGDADYLTVMTRQHLTTSSILIYRLQSSGHDYFEQVSHFLGDDFLPNNPDMELLNYLSMSLQPRGQLLRIYRIQNQFVIFTSTDNLDDLSRIHMYYKLLVGIAMQLYMADSAFIKAATDYLTGAVSTFVYPEHIVTAIETYKSRLVLEAYRQQLQTVLNTIITEGGEYDSILEDLRSQIDDIEVRLDELLNTFKVKSYQRFLVKESQHQDRSEILDYLVQTHHDKIIGARIEERGRSQSKLFISMRAPMNFSQDIAAYVANPSRNNLLDRHPERVQLLKDVNDKLVKVYLYASMRLSLPIVSNDDISQHGDLIYFSDMQQAQYAGQQALNDHIMGHDCFTAAKSNIRKYYAERKYEAMFDQMIYAVGSVNPYDGAAMPDTLSSLFNKQPSVVIIERRTDTGWQTMTLEEYYNEIIQANTRPNGGSN